MLPGILLYVNAGSQISKMTTIYEIYNFKVLFSFLTIGIFPLVVKKLMYYLKMIKTGEDL